MANLLVGLRFTKEGKRHKAVDELFRTKDCDRPISIGVSDGCEYLTLAAMSPPPLIVHDPIEASNSTLCGGFITFAVGDGSPKFVNHRVRLSKPPPESRNSFVGVDYCRESPRRGLFACAVFHDLHDVRCRVVNHRVLS